MVKDIQQTDPTTVLDKDWLRVARTTATPFDGAGTEHVAWLLYTLTRMTRPRCVLEYGPGYTTFFILAALEQNVADVGLELSALRQKTPGLGAMLEGGPLDGNAATRWLQSRDISFAIDPGFYLTPYEPKLYSLERCAITDHYATRIIRAVTEIGLDHRLILRTSADLDDANLPPDDVVIDLAWNDDRDYEKFFDLVWPRLDPSGGLMIFHNTAASAKGWKAVQSMREARSAHGDLEVLTLFESHKLLQNSCSILRRTSDYRPEHIGVTQWMRVLADLRRLFGTR